MKVFCLFVFLMFTAAFTFHAGDLINRAGRDAEWGEWFGAAAWINSAVPAMVVPGNHEYYRLPSGERQIDTHWRAQFTFPENGKNYCRHFCKYERQALVCHQKS